jgi:hypothetical protein
MFRFGKCLNLENDLKKVHILEKNSSNFEKFTVSTKFKFMKNAIKHKRNSRKEKGKNNRKGKK